jgi:phosphoglycolate phosphatase-like HAD superfamily hydrolase
MTKSPRLLLFDVDGTLINSRGAGRRGFMRAVSDVLGDGPSDVEVDYAGRTDRFIVTETLRQMGYPMPPAPEIMQRVLKSYIGFLKEEMETVPQDSVCPGIPRILDELMTRSHVVLGLLTGNIEEGAGVKLRHFGLDHYFPVGAFGDNHVHRHELVQEAIEDAQRREPQTWSPHSCWLIGDTPRDITAARTVGTHVAAVATGPFSYEELASLEPDLLFHDFNDPETVPKLAGETP